MDKALIVISVLAALSVMWCVVDAVLDRRHRKMSKKKVREWFNEHPEHWDRWDL